MACGPVACVKSELMAPSTRLGIVCVRLRVCTVGYRCMLRRSIIGGRDQRARGGSGWGVGPRGGSCEEFGLPIFFCLEFASESFHQSHMILYDYNNSEQNSRSTRKERQSPQTKKEIGRRKRWRLGRTFSGRLSTSTDVRMAH